MLVSRFAGDEQRLHFGRKREDRRGDEGASETDAVVAFIGSLGVVVMRIGLEAGRCRNGFMQGR